MLPVTLSVFHIITVSKIGAFIEVNICGRIQLADLVTSIVCYMLACYPMA